MDDITAAVTQIRTDLSGLRDGDDLVTIERVAAELVCDAAQDLATLREACDRIRAELIAIGKRLDDDDVLEQADQLVMAAHPIQVVRHE